MPMTIGKVIEEITKMPIIGLETALVYCPKNDLYHPPGPLCSWRGDYRQGCLQGRDDYSEVVPVHEVVKDFREAIGKRFPGYKGGKYLFSAKTRVWYGTFGQYLEKGLQRVELRDGQVLLIVEDEEFSSGDGE